MYVSTQTRYTILRKIKTLTNVQYTMRIEARQDQKQSKRQVKSQDYCSPPISNFDPNILEDFKRSLGYAKA